MASKIFKEHAGLSLAARHRFIWQNWAPGIQNCWVTINPSNTDGGWSRQPSFQATNGAGRLRLHQCSKVLIMKGRAVERHVGKAKVCKSPNFMNAPKVNLPEFNFKPWDCLSGFKTDSRLTRIQRAAFFNHQRGFDTFFFPLICNFIYLKDSLKVLINSRCASV